MTMISKEAENLLFEIIEHESDGNYWAERFEAADHREDTILRGCFKELKDNQLVDTKWADNIPYIITVLKDGYLYQQHKEEQKLAYTDPFKMKMVDILQEAIRIVDSMEEPSSKSDSEINDRITNWFYDVKIIYLRYLKNYPLSSEIEIAIQNKDMETIMMLFKSIMGDPVFMKDLERKHKEEQEKAERELTMSEFEKKLTELLERANSLSKPNRMKTDSQGMEQKLQANIWMDDVQTFHSTYLRNHPLSSRMDTLLFQRKFDELVAALTSISKDTGFIDKMNGADKVEVPKYHAKTLPEYDVFISHANKDKEGLIDELYESLNRLGIKIFYDKESLIWGDEWKKQILNGVSKAEFAIIVISKNFFDREWTEKELTQFLNRQNKNGQKLILPILHNISMKQLKDKYPGIADIQAINSKDYTCDQIALLFANILIKRLKSE